MQKYPNDEVPYRFRRKRPKTCCVSARGVVKGSWANEENANSFIAKHKLGELREAYPCNQHEGRWHIRSKRK